MKLIPFFGEISTKTKDTFKRFPITISWAIVGTLFALIVTESETFDYLFYGKVILTFILGISWLIATRFFEEQFNTDKEWIMLLTIVFLFLFYWHLPSESKDLESIYITRFVLYFIAGHLLVFIAPFLLKWNKSAYFNYLKTVFIAVIRSAFFSLVLYLGIILALLAIKHLFNVNFDGKLFFQIFIICLGVVNTWIYLSDFPKKIHSETAINYTKALEALVKYILIPLVILYLIILYAYSLKIIINWNLPKGWVSYLVVALSFLGFSIQMLINPIQKTIDSRTIKRFYPWFYYLLLPLIGLLFIAIFRRIKEYGFTEKRYFVLVLALWVLAMTIYMLFSKHKKIKFFPQSLAALALLISFGFWGAFSVSTKSQVHQFKKVFEEIKGKGFKMTYEENIRFRSIIRYLAEKKKIENIAPILGFNPNKAFKDVRKWNLSSKIIDSLHGKIIDKNGNDNNNQNKLRYFNLNTYNRTFKIDGYTYFKQISFNRDNEIDKTNTLLNYAFWLNKKANTISISNEKTNMLEVINLDSFIKPLAQNPDDGNIENIDDVTLTKSFKNLSVKIIFTNISLTKKEGKQQIQNANGYVFIKENE